MSLAVGNCYGRLKSSLYDPFYKNAFFMVMNKGLGVVSGFVFWALAARFYTVNEVGNAVVLISAASLIIAFSMMGFDISLVRFFHHYDKNKVFNTSLVVMVSTAFLVGVLYVVAVKYVAPDQAWLQSPVYALIFLLYIVLSAIGLVNSQTFIAMRDARYTFFQNVLYCSKIPLLFFLTFMGFFGIFSANVFSYVIAFLFVLLILNKFVKVDLHVDMEYIKKAFRTSSRNYVASILYNAAFLTVPIIISMQLGEADAAIYYMAFTVGNFLLQIPISLSTSFFVEGVYGESLRKNFIKAALTVYSILVPAAVFFFLFGGFILSLFGPGYVAGADLLNLVVISSFLYTLYSMFIPVLNIRMNVNTIIVLNAILFSVLLGLTWPLTGMFGINGFGYALILTFLAVDAAILFFAWRWKWIWPAPATHYLSDA
ncbi:lipopolysaccharide biosynthesis protein [Methanocella arvoryzae]|uniref:Oligosaccharide repeat unit transporter n=1 Tax=Methanocella arvoryzae (strain DSM 22066 / NBRC 105507 / MRE50) TaxID=351160 RepID=Q0W7C2_METAR|nr:oligosaccharide flippase family protein [Methanocella arvoryzae]CAJ35721.1 oligosaccharide repeat unit transporter [Methanocella arvoryzae MRE50]